MDTVAIKAYAALKHCPECGKTLEIDPISGCKACFLHGDFMLSDTGITWVYTRNLIKR